MADKSAKHTVPLVSEFIHWDRSDYAVQSREARSFLQAIHLLTVVALMQRPHENLSAGTA